MHRKTIRRQSLRAINVLTKRNQRKFFALIKRHGEEGKRLKQDRGRRMIFEEMAEAEANAKAEKTIALLNMAGQIH